MTRTTERLPTERMKLFAYGFLTFAICFLFIILGVKELVSERNNQKDISLNYTDLSMNPKLLERSNNRIITINTEICKPIICPQPNENIYTLQMCFNCSEEMVLK